MFPLQRDILFATIGVVIMAVPFGYMMARSPEENVKVTCPVPQYKPMSNDEIINETKKCEAAGLNAEGLKVEQLYGATFVMIQCRPKENK